MEQDDVQDCQEVSGAEPNELSGGSSIGLLLAAAVILFMASAFLPRHHFINPTYGDLWFRLAQDVAYGALALGGGMCVAVAVAWRWPGPWIKVERLVFASRRRRFMLACCLFSVITSALHAWYIFDGLPHIPDEIAMVFQGKVLASGKLFAKAPPLPEFFDWESIIVDGPKWYGKYFVGQSIALAPGLWVGLPWLVHPLLVVPALWLTYLLGLEIFGEKIARMSVLVMTLSPFRVVMFALFLAHPVTLVAMAVFTLGVLRVIKDPVRWGRRLAAGAASAVGWNSRPFTVAAMTLPLVVLVLARLAWRRLTARTVLDFVLAVAAGWGVYLGYNRALTGSALNPPFHVWSKTDRLGFGPDRGLEYWRPEDRGHTLVKGLFRDVYFNLDALANQISTVGAGVLPILAIALIWSPWPRRTWLVASIPLCVMVAYIFHVTHSVLAGQPRYWSEAMPMFMLLAAIGLAGVRRVLPIICRSMGIFPAVRTGRAACWLAGTALTLYGVGVYVFDTFTIEHHELWEEAADIRAVAHRESLENALVFVKTGGYYRTTGSTFVLDLYACGFMLNDPDLSGPVVYARDLGRAKNIELARFFPGRRLYWVDPRQVREMGIIPLDKAQTQRARMGSIK